MVRAPRRDDRERVRLRGGRPVSQGPRVGASCGRGRVTGGAVRSAAVAVNAGRVIRAVSAMRSPRLRSVMAGAFAVATVLAGAAHAPAASARCTIVFTFDWFRHDTANYVIAVARADSAIGAYWVRPVSWDSFPPPKTEEQRRNREALPRTGPVYGQWADITEAGDPTVTGRALFINWGTGSLCENMPTGKARWIEPGRPFFLEARPRFDTLAPRGISVFDITGVTNRYDPAWWQRFDSTGRV